MAVYYIVALCTALLTLFVGFVENDTQNDVTDIIVSSCSLPCKRQYDISIFIAIVLIGLLQLAIPSLQFTLSTRLTTLFNKGAAGDVLSFCRTVTQKNQTVQADLQDPRIPFLEQRLHEFSFDNGRLLHDNCQLVGDNRNQNKIVADLTISLKTLLKETEQHVPIRRQLREKVDELNCIVANLKTELDQREAEASTLRVRSEELAISLHQTKQALGVKSRECTNLRHQIVRQRIQIYKNSPVSPTLVAPETPVMSQVASAVTATMTPAVTPAVTATATPAVSPAKKPAVTATATPAVSPAKKPGGTAAATPAVTPAKTAVATPAVTPAKTAVATPAVTPAKTAAANPAVTPAKNAAATHAVTSAKTAAATPAVTPAAAQRSSSGPRLGSTLRRMFTRRKAAPPAEAECATVLTPGAYHLIIPVAESYVIQAAELERLKTVPLQTVLNCLR